MQIFYDFIKIVVNYFDNNLFYTFAGIVITISGIMKTIYKTTKKFPKTVLKTLSLLLTAGYLYVSFAYLSGWRFWVSQVIGWVALLNFFVFAKFIKKLKQMPSEKDLFNK